MSKPVLQFASRLCLLTCMGFILACNAEEKAKDAKEVKPIAGSTVGEATIVCDAEVYDIVMPAIQMHDAEYEHATITVESKDARTGMQQLMSGNTPGLIIARDYLPDEDSLRKSFDVERYTEYIFAKDALVFFVREDYPIDTLSHTLLRKKMLSSSPVLQQTFPQLTAEPHFVCTDVNSSVYGNVLLKITDMEAPKARFHFAGTTDSVLALVRNSANVIGISMLSTVVKHPDLRMIPIGFDNEDGVRIAPRLVHQSRIVMEMYPYPVSIRGWLLKGMTQDVVWGTFVYLARDAEVMVHFKEAGIVPEHARFNLKVTQ